MRDVLLWKELLAPQPDSERLLGPLRELAALTSLERFPFFGLLPKVLSSKNAALRAAAVQVLSGATGHLALQWLVERLDDPAEEVRRAAVDSLRESSFDLAGQPWVHALFHPNPEIRQQAIQGRQPSWFGFLTLPDEQCRGTIVEHLNQGLRIPETMLPALLDFVRKGFLPRDQASLLLGAMSWSDKLWKSCRSPARSSIQDIGGLLKESSGRAPDPDTLGPDALDEICDLLWDLPVNEIGNLEDPKFPQPILRDLLFWFCKKRDLGKAPGEHLRVVVSLAVTAARRRRWPDWVAGIMALLHPEFLAWKWVPREIRRGSIGTLFRLWKYPETLPQSQASALFSWDLCTKPNGLPDMWVVAGMLQYFRCDIASEVLFNAFSAKKMAASFEADLLGSMALFRIDNDHVSERLARILGRHLSWPKARIEALRILAGQSDVLVKAPAIGSDRAVEILEQLLELEKTPGTGLAPDMRTRVAEVLAGKLAEKAIHPGLKALLSLELPRNSALAMEVLVELSHVVDLQRFLAAAKRLSDLQLAKLLDLLPLLRHRVQALLAGAFRYHPNPLVLEKVQDLYRVLVPATALTRLKSAYAIHKLSVAQRDAIARCAEEDLPFHLDPALRAPSEGLCAALAERKTSTTHPFEVALALLGAHDPLEQVAHELNRHCPGNPDFLQELGGKVVLHWRERVRDPGLLPVQGNAWLYLWEQHCAVFGDWVMGRFGKVLPPLPRHARGLEKKGFSGTPVELSRRLTAVLADSAKLSFPPLSIQFWSACARLTAIWGARHPERLVAACDQDLFRVLIIGLSGIRAWPAAEMICAIHRCKQSAELLNPHLDSLRACLPDMTAEVRTLLSALVSSKGLAGGPAPRPETVETEAGCLLEVRSSSDLQTLRRHCGSGNPLVAREAVLRLLGLGAEGQLCLAALLRQKPPVPCAFVIAESVGFIFEEAPLCQIREFIRDDTACLELRFLAALGMCEHGEPFRDVAIALLQMESPLNWFKEEYWGRLLRQGLSERALALALVTSPQPKAYLRALNSILSLKGEVESPSCPEATKIELVDAVRAFLTAEDRLFYARAMAADWLQDLGCYDGLPISILANFGPGEAASGEEVLAMGRFLQTLPCELVEVVVSSVLAAGPKIGDEGRLTQALCKTQWLQVESIWRRLLEEGSQISWRAKIMGVVIRGTAREGKLRRLAESFAWGVREGRGLTGEQFSVEMIGSEALGYTRLEERKVFVTPLPILRGEPDGEDIVRGLIIHELGHHLYHGGPRNIAIWNAADLDGTLRMLNLVSDEHLERNLRASHPGYGNYLKRLAAYAFLHHARAFPVARLLETMQGRALEVLSRVRLTPGSLWGGRTAAGLPAMAYRVEVDSGKLLLELERAGSSFSRFMRALRLGQPGRHQDPKVQEALRLFGKTFRKLDFEGLLKVARRLREIFGAEAEMLEHMDQDSLLMPSEQELETAGEAITGEELARAVSEVLKRGSSASNWPGLSGAINLGKDTSFNRISNVVQLPFDRESHQRYARQVTFPARRMRDHFRQLGLAPVLERQRVQGAWLDRARLRQLVLRGDPRILMRRRLEKRTDLFLGIVIDCSGSMQDGDRIEKAKLFGTLLAEGAKGLGNLDVRIFGFTDTTIYDAGNAERCAACQLEVSGGNNDAAGLWHAALAARASRRRAKLLVMISDGLPAGCTAAALRELVERLVKAYGISCAQVALRPLAEVCFPHYIVLEEEGLAESVRKFGAVIGNLVCKSMGRA